MKSPALLLAGSLVANAVLVGLFAFQPAFAPPAIRGFFAPRSDSGRAPSTAASPKSAGSAPAKALTTKAAAAEAEVWDSLHPEDLKGLVARLRAAGFPTSVIRSVISSLVDARFASRYKELARDDGNTPYWKTSNSIFGINDDKRMELYRQISNDRSKLYRELLNDGLLNDNSGEVTAAQRRQFGDIPRSKIDLIQRINDDYAELTSQVRAAMQGITLPEDQEKLALLDREKHADLAAILTPEELADYEMRSSPLTSMMRNRLGTFDPTEPEFRALYQAQKMVSDAFAAAGGYQGFDYEARRTLQQQFGDQLKASLGPDRYAEYDRTQNRDYQQLTRLAERENIPPSTALQAFNLRDVVATESTRIFDDSSLTSDQKITALATLAQNTRAQLLATLGPTVGPAYIKVADSWLSNVERGSAVTFSGGFSGTMTSNNVTTFMGGGSPSYRRVPPPRPPGAQPVPPAANAGLFIRQ